MSKQVQSGIRIGDVLEQLSYIRTGSISCITTSPPYYLQRKYGKDSKEWGSEENFIEYLYKMSVLMKELHRVLEPRGTCFINIGDKYAKRNEIVYDRNARMYAKIMEEPLPILGNVRKGSLYGIPARFQANCIDQGWICENAITWFKPNAMPLSVKTRLTNKYEPVYYLVKEKDHYYNLNAIKVLAKTQTQPKFNLRVRESKKGRLHKKYGNEWKASKKEHAEHNKNGVKKQDIITASDGKVLGHYKGFNARWKEQIAKKTGPYMKNPGDVLSIPVKPNPVGHQATYPEALVEVFLKSGCRPNGVVLDPFFGSGTTAVVAERLGLQWMGIELYESYAKDARTRIRMSNG